jgi:hypothetical protein
MRLTAVSVGYVALAGVAVMPLAVMAVAVTAVAVMPHMAVLKLERRVVN